MENKLKYLHYLMLKNDFDRFEMSFTKEETFGYKYFIDLFELSFDLDLKFMKFIFKKWNGEINKSQWSSKLISNEKNKIYEYYNNIIFRCANCCNSISMFKYVVNDFKKRFENHQEILHSSKQRYAQRINKTNYKYYLYLVNNTNISIINTTKILSGCFKFMRFKRIKKYIKKYQKKIVFDLLISDERSKNVDEYFKRIDLYFEFDTDLLYYDYSILFEAMGNVIDLFGSNGKIMSRLLKHVDQILLTEIIRDYISFDESEVVFIDKNLKIICDKSSYTLFVNLFETKFKIERMSTYFKILKTLLLETLNKNKLKKIKFITDNYFEIHPKLKNKFKSYFKQNVDMKLKENLSGIFKIFCESFTRLNELK